MSTSFLSKFRNYTDVLTRLNQCFVFIKDQLVFVTELYKTYMYVIRVSDGATVKYEYDSLNVDDLDVNFGKIGYVHAKSVLYVTRTPARITEIGLCLKNMHFTGNEPTALSVFFGSNSLENALRGIYPKFDNALRNVLDGGIGSVIPFTNDFAIRRTSLECAQIVDETTSPIAEIYRGSDTVKVYKEYKGLIGMFEDNYGVKCVAA